MSGKSETAASAQAKLRDVQRSNVPPVLRPLARPRVIGSLGARGVSLALALALPVVVGCGGDGASGGGGSSHPNGGGVDGGGGDICDVSSWKAGFAGSQTIEVDGTAHSYELFVPDGYDGKTRFPVVVVFHGDGGTGANIRSGFKIEEASAKKAIVVYPDGPGKTWQIDKLDTMGKDIAFVDALYADLTKSHCADSSRLYATGFSKGAYFVNQLACRSKTTLRAITTHAGGGPFGVAESEFSNGDLKCATGALAALQVAGLADDSVPPSEGEKARDHWRGANGCQDATSAWETSPCVAYQGCSKPEVWCAVPELRHQIWSEAAKVTWSFFSKN